MSRWVVDVTLAERWLLGLDQPAYERVIAALEFLAEQGTLLERSLLAIATDGRWGTPAGSSERPELRLLFAMNRRRVAVMLLGDKTDVGHRTLDYQGPESMTLADLLVKRPANAAIVNDHKARMYAQTQQGEFGETYTGRGIPSRLADDSKPRQTTWSPVPGDSATDSNDIEYFSLDALRRHAQALGGHLRIEFEIDGHRIHVA